MILRKPLGQIMAKMGFITRQQLNEALQRQKRILGEKPLSEQTQRGVYASYYVINCM